MKKYPVLIFIFLVMTGLASSDYQKSWVSQKGTTDSPYSLNPFTPSMFYDNVTKVIGMCYQSSDTNHLPRMLAYDVGAKKVLSDVAVLSNYVLSSDIEHSMPYCNIDGAGNIAVLFDAHATKIQMWANCNAYNYTCFKNMTGSLSRSGTYPQILRFNSTHMGVLYRDMTTQWNMTYSSDGYQTWTPDAPIVADSTVAADEFFYLHSNQVSLGNVIISGYTCKNPAFPHNNTRRGVFFMEIKNNGFYRSNGTAYVLPANNVTMELLYNGIAAGYSDNLAVSGGIKTSDGRILIPSIHGNDTESDSPRWLNTSYVMSVFVNESGKWTQYNLTGYGLGRDNINKTYEAIVPVGTGFQLFAMLNNTNNAVYDIGIFNSTDGHTWTLSKRISYTLADTISRPRNIAQVDSTQNITVGWSSLAGKIYLYDTSTQDFAPGEQVRNGVMLSGVVISGVNIS